MELSPRNQRTVAFYYEVQAAGFDGLDALARANLGLVGRILSEHRRSKETATLGLLQALSAAR